MNIKKKTIKLVVTYKIEYDTAKGKKEAIESAKELTRYGQESVGGGSDFWYKTNFKSVKLLEEN